MDDERYRVLVESLEQAVAAETAQRGLDLHGQIDWLAEHLDEYIDRWLGFCRVPTLQMTALLQSDLFVAIEIGAASLARRLETAGEKLQVAWNEFADSLNRLRLSTDKNDAARLREAFDRFRRVLNTEVK